MTLPRFHRWIGYSTVVLFLLSGQYMEYRGVHSMEDAARMTFRSRHLYLLFSGLVNLAMGIYMPSAERKGRYLQWAGSALLVAAPPIALVAFLRESGSFQHSPVLTFLVTVTLTAGTLCHAVAAGRAAKDATKAAGAGRT